MIKGYAAHPETLNAYGYCWGNRLKYVDRDGEFTEWVQKGIDNVKEWWDENVGIDETISHDGPKTIIYSSTETTYHKGGNTFVFQVKNGKLKNISYNEKVTVGATTIKGSFGMGTVSVSINGKIPFSNEEYNVKGKYNYIVPTLNVEDSSKKDNTTNGFSVPSAIMDILAIAIILCAVPGGQPVGAGAIAISMIAFLAYLGVDTDVLEFNSSKQCIS